ncbi:hypothetical protein LCGC14_2290240 [marine sediment metagenome]|uniref:Uncharacterized protein n=1 Tax=marine sediment metagenome TaxID=412755 RepID=A0A0F9CRE4_9ZZZZ
MVFDKNLILNADDLEIREVKIGVKGWPEVLWVRTLTGAERDSWEAGIVNLGPGEDKSYNLKNIRARFVSMVACEKSGNRIFDNGDVAALGTKSAQALDLIFDAGQKLNGIRDDDLEGLAGNSAATPADCSI